ncbi:MAG: DsbC family protein [Geobacteraceae bacterium]|nr:DsbC family protein [Geobacteraceae bacterium]
MKRILPFLVIAVLLTAGANDVFSASSAKKATRKAPASYPDRAMIHKCESCHSLSIKEANAIFTGLGEVKAVTMSPVKGLYEVTVLQGNRQAVAYLDFSKKLLVPGPIFDTETKKSLTPPPEELPKILSKAELNEIPLTDSIIMGNPSGKKRLIVFTDPDCSFCARLHTELKKLVVMEPDLAIYIKMFPLKMHPKAYDKARVIVGSNSLELLEKAFEKGTLPEPGAKDPKEPVDETIKIGESLGIDGTPAMIFPDGKLVSGVRDAETIRKMLESIK